MGDDLTDDSYNEQTSNKVMEGRDKELWDKKSMKIGIKRNGFSHISFKFGDFAAQLNLVARLRHVAEIEIEILDSKFLSSFHDVIGINDIDINRFVKIREIDVTQHSFAIVDFEAIPNIRDEIEAVVIRNNNKKLTSLSYDGASQLQPCFDFNTFNDMPQLKRLHLSNNQIECIINFESIQQHTQLQTLNLENNHLLSSIDFSKFDESKPLMNSLYEIKFNNMTLKYTRQNNSCLDLQFLRFMPNLRVLDFSNNKIECIDNVSILQRKDLELRRLDLDNNKLLSFDFAALIGSNNFDMHLENLSLESVTNWNEDSESKLRLSGGRLKITVRKGHWDYDALELFTTPRAVSIS